MTSAVISAYLEKIETSGTAYLSLLSFYGCAAIQRFKDLNGQDLADDFPSLALDALVTPRPLSNTWPPLPTDRQAERVFAGCKLLRALSPY